ncbi:MAG TPA: hypothetical protein VMT52_20615 [Planctomycetota bacterium]|nr:hypothetical protein [Planctomycetota bacterium]
MIPGPTNEKDDRGWRRPQAAGRGAHTGTSVPEEHRDQAERPYRPSGLLETRDGGGRMSLRAETGAALERQILLERSREEEKAIARTGRAARRRRPIALITASGLAVAAVALVFCLLFLERRELGGKLSALEKTLQETSREAAAREEALRRASLEKDQALEERKFEAQTLAALADKTLEALKASLEDARRLREEGAKLEADYQALKARPLFPGLAAAFSRVDLNKWLPRWLLAR